MKGKRTGIDFTNHELIISDEEYCQFYYLKKPCTRQDSIKYINTSGVLAVTGDYSNWIFCREFHPTAEGGASSQYWNEKLRNSSCQEPSKFDGEETEKRIKEILSEEENELSEEAKEWLNELLQRTDDELDYTYHAYRENPSDWDLEYVPFEKTVKTHFLVILDGFDEMCRRMKEEKENIIYK